MSVWDVHYRSTTNGDSLDVGAFHIRESEDHDFGFVHATADHSCAARAQVVCECESAACTII